MTEDRRPLPRALSVSELAVHMPAVRRYLTRFLRRDELDDGIQTVMERALVNVDRFRGESSPRTWLIGIARNVGLELARARRRRPTLVEYVDLFAEELPCLTPSAEERLGRLEHHALALAVLTDMELDDKLALLVTYADGLSGPDAADLLGVSHAAFRQRLSRARETLGRRLRARLENGDPAEAETLAAWQTLFAPDVGSVIG
jgi:RNA polymerase sigma-70 factor, ECF subfamily